MQHNTIQGNTRNDNTIQHTPMQDNAKPIHGNTRHYTVIQDNTI